MDSQSINFCTFVPFLITMRYISADYIFPVATAPVKNGVITLDDSGQIIDMSAPGSFQDLHAELEYFKGIICPGFINAHCHLELSHLKNQLTTHTGLTGFILQILEKRNGFSSEIITNSIETAEQEMHRNGIVAVGDICNNDNTFSLKTANNLLYHSFIEILGLNPQKAEETMANAMEIKRIAKGNNLEASIVPHAAYTLSVQLLKLINEDAKKNNAVISIHNQESETESEMFISGSGKMAAAFTAMGIAPELIRKTGTNSLLSALPHLKDAKKILLVHNTYTCAEDLRWIKSEFKNRKAEIYFCTCPNANMFIENKLPDYNLFIAENCLMTIGTDSLASNWSLSILDEMKTIVRRYPDISLQTLLTWATKNGASFFDYKNLGTIEKGKSPGLNWLKNTDGMKITEETEIEKII